MEMKPVEKSEMKMVRASSNRFWKLHIYSIFLKKMLIDVPLFNGLEDL